MCGVENERPPHEHRSVRGTRHAADEIQLPAEERGAARGEPIRQRWQRAPPATVEHPGAAKAAGGAVAAGDVEVPLPGGRERVVDRNRQVGDSPPRLAHRGIELDAA